MPFRLYRGLFFGIVTAFSMAFVALAPTTVHAVSILIGVTGDGAANLPSEALFTISKTSATPTFFMDLGAGNDGEAIAYNPVDGLHAMASS